MILEKMTVGEAIKRMDGVAVDLNHKLQEEGIIPLVTLEHKRSGKPWFAGFKSLIEGLTDVLYLYDESFEITGGRVLLCGQWIVYNAEHTCGMYVCVPSMTNGEFLPGGTFDIGKKLFEVEVPYNEAKAAVIAGRELLDKMIAEAGATWQAEVA